MLTPAEYARVTPSDVIDAWLNFPLPDLMNVSPYLHTYAHNLREAHLNALSDWMPWGLPAPRKSDEQITANNIKKNQNNERMRKFEKAIRRMVNRKLIQPHHMHHVRKLEDLVLLSRVCHEPPFSEARTIEATLYYDGIFRLNPRNA